MALISLILGIIGILCSGLPFVGALLGITAIVLGFLGRQQLLKEGRSAGLAMGGIATGVVAFLIGTLMTTACLVCGNFLDSLPENSDYSTESFNTNTNLSSVNPAQASGRLSGLESHLHTGATYGEGPGGQQMANSIRLLFDDEAAIAVAVVPGNPRHIVIIVKHDDLRYEPDEERRRLLEEIKILLDRSFGAQDADIGIGLRGRVLFGAIATRPAGTSQLNQEVSSTVSQAPLEQLLIPSTVPLPPGTIDQWHYGEISATDSRFTTHGQNMLADRYPINVPANSNLMVSMFGHEIDSYLHVLGPNGNVVAEDDDSAGALNSRTVLVAPQPGTYTVIATELSNSPGQYSLRIQVVPNQPVQAVPTQGLPAQSGSMLTVGSVTNAAFTASTPVETNTTVQFLDFVFNITNQGEYAIRIHVDPPVDVVSFSFDIFQPSPGGNTVATGDLGTNSNFSPGTYTMRVYRNRATSIGPFRVSLNRVN